MKHLFRRALVLVMAVAMLLGACRRSQTTPAPEGESCGLTDDGGTYEVGGRADGLYGVRADRLEAAPLARFDRIVRTGEGIDPKNGKRWIKMHLAEDDARATRTFTTDPADKKIAVVAGGQIASVHKVREAITSADVQVSCCNPSACDRWNTVLAPAK